MRPDVLLMVYCAAIAAASLLGGWLPLRLAVSHTRMQMLMSFLGGMMMGVAVLHLLPHAILRANSVDGPALAMLVGLIGMLLLMRCLHFHQHDLPAETGESHAHGPDCQHNLPAPILEGIGMIDSQSESLPVVSHDHDHDHLHDHDHGHAHDHGHDGHDHDHHHGGHRHDSHGHQHDARGGSHPYAWVGLFLGLALHALLDGVALAASVKAEAHDNPGIMLVGIAAFLAIALHKPLDSLSLISLMTFGRWQSGTTVGVNLLYAFITPLGAIATWYGIQQFSLLQPELLGWTLGLSAGVFLCIALVDVVPEIQFHSHDRMKLSLLLLCGVLVAWLIGLVEPGHDPASGHNHGHTIQSR